MGQDTRGLVSPQGSLPHHVEVRHSLSDEGRAEVEQGSLTGPDGRRYFRRTTRAKRKEADQLVAGHAPVVLYYWAGGVLEWCDDVDAVGEWQTIRPQVLGGSAMPRGGGEIQWTAGRWEDEEGRPLLFLTGHC